MQMITRVEAVRRRKEKTTRSADRRNGRVRRKFRYVSSLCVGSLLRFRPSLTASGIFHAWWPQKTNNKGSPETAFIDPFRAFRTKKKKARPKSAQFDGRRERGRNRGLGASHSAAALLQALTITKSVESGRDMLPMPRAAPHSGLSGDLRRRPRSAVSYRSQFVRRIRSGTNHRPLHRAPTELERLRGQDAKGMDSADLECMSLAGVSIHADF